MDDDEYNIFALQLLLLNIDVKADTANNGKTAVEMIKEKFVDTSCSCSYKLILMDCNMPVMNGYEACRKIRTLERLGVINKL